MYRTNKLVFISMNDTNKLVGDRLNDVISHLKMSVPEFARSLGFDRADKIYNIVKNKFNPSYDILAAITNKFVDIDINWLITGKGTMLKVKNESEPALKLSINEYISTEAEIISIPIVDVSAAAGHGFFNPDYNEKLGEINLPAIMLQKKYGNYYCGIVNGESMSPTLLHRDYIVFRLLAANEWQYMKDDDVYFIVDRSGASCVKRIKNNLSKDGNIICMSDNIDKANFRDFLVPNEDISNIYHVEWRFSKDLSNINSLYYDRLSILESDMKAIKENFKRLKK